MAPRRIRRNGWHQVNGKWTRSLGERGSRVRLFEKRRNGLFYREVWIPGDGYNRACLHTSDRDVAERLGRELLANLLKGEVMEAAGVVGAIPDSVCCSSRQQGQNPKGLCLKGECAHRVLW